MPQVETSTGEIYYEEEGNGLPILLVHGNYASSRWWKPIMGEIKGHKTIALDLPCFGRSSKPVSDHRISTYAQYLEEFIDKMDLDNFDLVGHSLGGGIATIYVLQNPEKVKNLILISPPPANGMEFSIFQKIIFKIARRSERFLKNSLNKLVPEDYPLHKELWKDALAMKDSAVQGHIDALEEYDVTNQLSNLESPLYLIRGENDEIVEEGDLKKYEEYAEKYIVMKNTGHAAYIDSTNDFINILEDMIK